MASFDVDEFVFVSGKSGSCLLDFGLDRSAGFTPSIASITRTSSSRLIQLLSNFGSCGGLLLDRWDFSSNGRKRPTDEGELAIEVRVPIFCTGI